MSEMNEKTRKLRPLLPQLDMLRSLLALLCSILFSTLSSELSALLCSSHLTSPHFCVGSRVR